MKKILFFLLFSVFAFGQNYAKDTLMGGGTEPATIIKLQNHKIFIAQNKEHQTPFKLQDDGSFLSPGIPDIQITLGEDMGVRPLDFFTYLLSKQKKGEKREIIENNKRPVFLTTIENKKDSIMIFSAMYPLENRIITFNLSFFYTDISDKSKKDKAIRNIIENGFMVIEDYYLYRKI